MAEIRAAHHWVFQRRLEGPVKAYVLRKAATGSYWRRRRPYYIVMAVCPGRAQVSNCVCVPSKVELRRGPPQGDISS